MITEPSILFIGSCGSDVTTVVAPALEVVVTMCISLNRAICFSCHVGLCTDSLVFQQMN